MYPLKLRLKLKWLRFLVRSIEVLENILIFSVMIVGRPIEKMIAWRWKLEYKLSLWEWGNFYER